MLTCNTQANVVELAPEDRLWEGLQFEILETDELPAQHSAGGDVVHFHRGIWWKQLNRFFCLPCSMFQLIDPQESWPEWHHSLLGYIHLCGPNHRSNSIYRAVVNDALKQYSINSLPKKQSIKDVRRALNNVEVRAVDRDTFLREGGAVYHSWHDQVGWGRDRSGEVFSEWVKRVCDRPKRMILGAFAGDKLIAFMLPYATGHVVRISFTASHTDYLKLRPNDALYHALLTIARQTPGLTLAQFGPVCAKPSLNEFKLRYGRVRDFRAYTKLNPLVRSLVGAKLQARYPWLGLDEGKSEAAVADPQTSGALNGINS